MTTHPVYDALLEEIDDALERQVFEALAEKAGETLTRPALVFKVFGKYVQKTELSNCAEDRKIRECIEHLRDRDYPIHSSSGEAGYTLTTDDEAIDEYIAEQRSRMDNLRRRIEAAYRSKRKAAAIRTWRETAANAVQLGMFQ
jgi:hypothetical protein